MRTDPTISPVLEARSAGEGFVHTRAFEVLSRTGFVARGVVYAIIGAARTRPRRRSGRQDHKPARRTPHDRASAVRPSAAGAGRDRAWRLLALEALSRRARPRPRGCRRRTRPSRRLRERDRLRADVRGRRRDPDELRRILRKRQEDDRGRIRMAGRPLVRRNRGHRDDRRRDLPACPRAPTEVPRRLEDRADEARVQEVVHGVRNRRARGKSDRLRARRELS